VLLCAARLPFAAPVAAHDPIPVYDRVRLSANAGRDVDSDTLVATLYKEHQATQQATAANEVNRDVTWAIEQAKVAGVKIQTVAYRTQPVYQKQHIQGWRVHQSIRLESGDSAKMASLLGDLQQRLSIQSLQNSLSNDARKRAEEDLLVEALHAFQEKAALIASTLGRSGHRIVEIGIDGSGTAPPVPMVMRSMQADSVQAVAPPSLEGGTLRVEVRVSGSVELGAPGP
jgi:predicted secreted protein